jgi:hypothetical protein
MKLELKHLAPYLPYDVNIKIINTNRNYKVNTIKKLSNQLFSDYFLKSATIFKPILRPLSDLINSNVKDEHGEPIDYEYKSLSLIQLNAYYKIELLFKNHFDVFGLIEKGLAIDVNTLES